ncbi:DNA polymerase delta, subunit 4-domain-containing protein [Phyllosticta citribraziliensis]|uniref:DNA polymerase delta, subunit 4-domain-containing protein n=1 Tax=Phyllosticta citribraziliensis TaxID=989973 RepID=A0ABR1LSW4_9PEZI
MPPKRATPVQGKQATLAFHGSSNKVTKPGKPSNDKSKLDHIKRETALSSPHFQDEEKLTERDNAQTQNIPQLTPEEKEASQVSDAQIKKYWRTKEEARLAQRVHQEGLTIHEKVLREFDTTGNFGPCIGISRQKRWKRAQRLGLKPPIEVLAVLIKEGRDNARVQRAHVDELMASRFADD